MKRLLIYAALATCGAVLLASFVVAWLADHAAGWADKTIGKLIEEDGAESCAQEGTGVR